MVYTYAFDVGATVNHSDLADRLLKAGIAECALAADDDRVRLAPRFLKLLKNQGQAKRLIEVKAYLDKKISFSELRLASRLYLFWIALSVRLSSLPLVRRFVVEPGENRESTSLSELLSESIGAVNEAIRGMQLVLAAHSAVDRSLYRSGYLVGTPYYRLQLHALRLTKAEFPLKDYPGDDDSVEVELLLHRSGVALLSFILSTENNISLDDLEKITVSDRARFRSFELVEPVVDAYSKGMGMTLKQFSGERSDEMREGSFWWSVETAEANSIVDLFSLHRDAILHFAGEIRSHAWICCPTVFVDHLKCCTSREMWVRNHWKQLLAVLGNVPPREDVDLTAQESRLAVDYSHSRSRSFFVPGGFALDLNWLFGEESNDDLLDCFNRTTVIENSLIQYWQLHILDAALSVEDYSRVDVLNAVAQYSFGLEEVRGPQFAYGTANELSSEHFKKLGGTEIDARAGRKLSDLKGLIEARSSLLVARRSSRLSAGALLGALVLGLPAIKQGVDVVASVPVVVDWIRPAASAIPLAMDANILSILLYVLFVASVIPVLALRGRDRVQIAPKPEGRTVGVVWLDNEVRIDLESRRSSNGNPGKAPTHDDEPR